MVDGYGHVVTVAPDYGGENCGGERGLSRAGGDPNIEEAVDNVVRAIYKRAKREGNLEKKEEGGEKKQENNVKNEVGTRKRKLEDAEIS